MTKDAGSPTARVWIVPLIAVLTFGGLWWTKSGGRTTEDTRTSSVPSEAPETPAVPEAGGLASTTSDDSSTTASRRVPDGMPAARTPDREPESVRRGIGPVAWYGTWADAAAAARKASQPILVYLHMDPVACPPCRRLDTEVFGVPAASSLSASCVPLRVDVDRPPGPGIQQLLARLAPKGFPMLALVTPDMGVLHRQVSRLYASYGSDYRRVGMPPTNLLALPDLLRMTKRAGERMRAEDAALASLVGADDAASLRERSRIEASRENWAAAIRASRRALTQDPSLHFAHEQMRLFVRAGRTAEAVSGFQGLLAAAPKHPLALSWQYELLQLDPDPSPAADRRALRQFIARAAAAGKRVLEARARLLELRRQGPHDRAVFEGHLGWFQSHYLSMGGRLEPDGALPPDVRWEIANTAKLAGRHADAFEHLQALRTEHPESPEAQYMKHGLFETWRDAARGGQAGSPGTR